MNISTVNNTTAAENMTPLRISTMTAIGSLPCQLSLKDTFEKMHVTNIIRGIEFQNDIKGETRKKKKKRTSTTDQNNKKRCFYNQITLVLCLNDKKMNVKIFKNGKLQLTGVKSESAGKQACQHIYEMLCQLKLTSLPSLGEEKEKEPAINYRTVMINSDFKIGFPIRRNELFRLFVKKYNFRHTTFEPCIYPGVNAKYYWNELTQKTDKAGRCCCSALCNGKGCGNGDGQCKKITIATFQSGTVIITGATSLQQLNDVHAFVVDMYNRERDVIDKNQGAMDAVAAETSMVSSTADDV